MSDTVEKIKFRIKPYPDMGEIWFKGQVKTGLFWRTISDHMDIESVKRDIAGYKEAVEWNKREGEE